MICIEVKALTKQYKVNMENKKTSIFRKMFQNSNALRTAIHGISFKIEQGETVGYIGINGSGKSTTIKILSGILSPTSGWAKVGNIVPYENRKQNAMQISAVFGQRTQLWWDLPLVESFKLMKAIYKIPDCLYHSNFSNLCNILGLSELLNIPVRQLSLGQRMRGDLAAALLHNPKVLYLDEPTIGMDVFVKEKMRALIKEINQRNKTTIFLTSNDLSDVEEICKRIILIDKGQILYDGTLNDLYRKFGCYRILIIEFENEIEDLKLDAVQVLKKEDKKYWLKFDSEKTKITQLINYFNHQYTIKDFSVREGSLETYIRMLYKENILENAGI